MHKRREPHGTRNVPIDEALARVEAKIGRPLRNKERAYLLKHLDRRDRVKAKQYNPVTRKSDGNAEKKRKRGYKAPGQVIKVQ